MKNEESQLRWKMKNDLHFICAMIFFIFHSSLKKAKAPHSQVRLESVMPLFSVKTTRKSLFSVVFA